MRPCFGQWYIDPLLDMFYRLSLAAAIGCKLYKSEKSQFIHTTHIQSGLGPITLYQPR